MTETAPHVNLALSRVSAQSRIARVPLIGALWERFVVRRPEAQEQRFVWISSSKDIRPDAVACILLPATDPVGLLAACIRAGLEPDHVVFVGDTTTMTHKVYDAVVQKGALVHHTNEDLDKQQQERVEDDLAPYYDAQKLRVEPRHRVNNPYTYTPAPPKVTPEEFRAFIQAAAVRERR